MTSLRAAIPFIMVFITLVISQSSPTGFRRFGPPGFTLTVYKPGSPLHGQLVNAAGESFYLGLDGPSTYCPQIPDDPCPPNTGDQTILDGMGAMYNEVPGGQQIYTTSGGIISYTVAHSMAIPPTAYVGDFTNVTVARGCGVAVHVVNWQSPVTNGVVTKGILACPHIPWYMIGTPNGTATYRIYANTPAFNQTDCITVDGLLPHYLQQGIWGPWEYN